VVEESVEVLLVEAISVLLVEIVVHPGGFLEDTAGEGLEDLRGALLELSLGYETTSGVVTHLPGSGGGVFDDSSVASLSLAHSSEESEHSSESGLVGMSQDFVDVVSISVDNASSETDSALAASELRSRDKTTSGSVTFLEGTHGSGCSSAFVVSSHDLEELGELLLVETVGSLGGVALEHVLDVASHFLECAFLEEFGTTFLPLRRGDSATSGSITDFPGLLQGGAGTTPSLTLQSLEEFGELLLVETVGSHPRDLMEGTVNQDSGGSIFEDAFLDNLSDTFIPLRWGDHATSGSIADSPGSAWT
jgi:hypothetical protein